MKVSEAIEALCEILHDHGDIELAVINKNEDQTFIIEYKKTIQAINIYDNNRKNAKVCCGILDTGFDAKSLTIH